MKMVCILSGHFLFFQTAFLLFQLEQPIAVADYNFLRTFSLFSRLFFTFADDKLLLQLLGFVLISGISGCLWCLATQLCFSRMFLISRPGSQASSAQDDKAFSLSVFQQTSAQYFPRSPLWLLASPSHTHSTGIFSYLPHPFFTN